MKTMERITLRTSYSTKTNFRRENFDTYFDAFISFSCLTCICVNAHSGLFMQRLNWRNSYTMTIRKLAWENSWHFATQALVSPRNNVWGTRAEIPYWWRATIQIWVVILIGCADMEICFNQSDAVTRSWQWHANVTEFMRSLPRYQFRGETVSGVAKCRLFSQAIKRPQSFFLLFLFFFYGSGHFRVPSRLCFKTRVIAQPLIWRSFFIHFHKKGCAPSLILKVWVFGTRKRPI